MSSRTVARTSDIEELVQLLAKVLAPHLGEHLSPSAHAAIGFYHQGDSPLGKRHHLDLVRRGVLAGHKTGRRVFILRDDVHAYINACNAARRANQLNADDPLEDWGLARAGQP